MNKINRILCPVDFSPASDKAVQLAANLALKHGAKIHLLHVVTPVIASAHEYPLNPVDSLKAMEQAAAAELKKLQSKIMAKGVQAATEVRVGDVRAAISRSILVAKPDLVVMGTHSRRGIDRWVMGSVTEWMMRHSPLPLLTISAKETTARPNFNRILVTTDFSEGTSDALTYALSVAEANKSQVTFMHVIHDAYFVDLPDTYHDSLKKAVLMKLDDLVPARPRNGSKVVSRVERGIPYETILQIVEKEKPSLVVMNIHGKGMIDRALLGSTAERVVRAAQCPVMLIPPMKKTIEVVKPRRAKPAA